MHAFDRQIGQASGYVAAMPEQSTSLGARLRAMRRAAGLTQAQLASRAKVSRSVIAGIESDEPRTRTLAVLERLARACGRPVAELTSGIVRVSALDELIEEWERLEKLRPITQPTPEEIRWLRRLPPAFWTEMPPSIEVLEALVSLRRKGKLPGER